MEGCTVAPESTLVKRGTRGGHPPIVWFLRGWAMRVLATLVKRGTRGGHPPIVQFLPGWAMRVANQLFKENSYININSLKNIGWPPSLSTLVKTAQLENGVPIAHVLQGWTMTG